MHNPVSQSNLKNYYSSKTPVYIFDQKTGEWYTFNGNKFIVIKEIPKLTFNFAGIGTRELTENGKNAIIGVYKNTFKNLDIFGPINISHSKIWLLLKRLSNFW